MVQHFKLWQKHFHTPFPHYQTPFTFISMPKKLQNTPNKISQQHNLYSFPARLTILHTTLYLQWPQPSLYPLPPPLLMPSLQGNHRLLPHNVSPFPLFLHHLCTLTLVLGKPLLSVSHLSQNLSQISQKYAMNGSLRLIMLIDL